RARKRRGPAEMSSATAAARSAVAAGALFTTAASSRRLDQRPSRVRYTTAPSPSRLAVTTTGPVIFSFCSRGDVMHQAPNRNARAARRAADPKGRPPRRSRIGPALAIRRASGAKGNGRIRRGIDEQVAHTRNFSSRQNDILYSYQNIGSNRKLFFPDQTRSWNSFPPKSPSVKTSFSPRVGKAKRAHRNHQCCFGAYRLIRAQGARFALPTLRRTDWAT